MSKSHQIDQSQQDDLDAALDNFIKTKKVDAAVPKSVSEPIDLFGGGAQKKKSLLNRLRILFQQIFSRTSLT